MTENTGFTLSLLFDSMLPICPHLVHLPCRVNNLSLFRAFKQSDCFSLYLTHPTLLYSFLLAAVDVTGVLFPILDLALGIKGSHFLCWCTLPLSTINFGSLCIAAYDFLAYYHCSTLSWDKCPSIPCNSLLLDLPGITGHGIEEAFNS